MAAKRHILEAALKAQKKQENVSARLCKARVATEKKYIDEWENYYDTLSKDVRDVLATLEEDAEADEDTE